MLFTKNSSEAWAGDVWKAQAWLTQRFSKIVVIEDEICGCGIIPYIKFDLPDKKELLKFQWQDFSNELLRITKWSDYVATF